MNKDRNNKSANSKKKETEIKSFYLLSKKSSETVILTKGIHEIGVAFGANRIGECSTSLQIRACKYWNCNTYFPDLPYLFLLICYSTVSTIHHYFICCYYYFYSEINFLRSFTILTAQ